jgi:predicted transcriptional regulator
LVIVGLLLERRPWNGLKIKVLGLLKQTPGLTSQDISTNLEITVSSAGMVLLNLHRQRLVDRRRPVLWHVFKKPHYEYFINDRGLAKLNYLRQKQSYHATGNKILARQCVRR